MSSATHVTITPDLGGWGFVTTIEENGRMIRRGHKLFADLVSYVEAHGLAALVDEEGTAPGWASQVVSRLTAKGVEIITDHEHVEAMELDRYWIARVENRDRVEWIEADGQTRWGTVVNHSYENRKYIEVWPDNWRGSTYIAGRWVRTLITKGEGRK